MTPRELATRAFAHFASGAICLLALLAIALRGIVIEVFDDVRASRETKRLRGNMQPNNTKLTDSISQMRAQNAKLAALVGDSSRAAATLSDARQLAAEVAMSRSA
jgi:hypothetical protein